MRTCSHHPPCPPGQATWLCGKRTVIEHARADGTLTPYEAWHLALSYGFPLTPYKAVYKGAPVRGQPKFEGV